MQPLRKILFAADFSENSKEAFRTACSVATENKTRIFVLHVAEPNWVPQEPVYYGQQAIQFHAAEPDKAHHEAMGRKCTRSMLPTVLSTWSTGQRRETPPQEILRVADEIGSDLIVMGTHGRKGLSGWWPAAWPSPYCAADLSGPGSPVRRSSAPCQGDPSHPPPHRLLGRFRGRTPGGALACRRSRSPAGSSSTSRRSRSSWTGRGRRRSTPRLPRRPRGCTRAGRWSGPQAPG